MDVSHCVNFLLSASQNVVFQYFGQKLSEFGVTPAQYGVLNCLWSYGQLSPSKIREILVLEASSVSGILDRMQKNGLIERSIDPSNRRAILVSPTQKAMDIREGVEGVVDEMNARFLEPFSEEERVFLKNALRKIIELDHRR